MKSSLVCSLHGFEYDDPARTFRETVEQVQLAEKFGFDFPILREAYVAETDEQAWAEVREGVLFIYQEYLDWGHLLDEDGQPVAPGESGALDALRQRFIVGSPESCIRQALKVKQELGGTNLMMRMKFPRIPQDKVLNSIKLWGEKVLPAIA